MDKALQVYRRSIDARSAETSTSTAQKPNRAVAQVSASHRALQKHMQEHGCFHELRKR